MLRRGWIERGFVVGAPPIPVGQWRRDAPDRTGQVSIQKENPYPPPNVTIGKDVTREQLEQLLNPADLAAVWVARQWLEDLTASPENRQVFHFKIGSGEQTHSDGDGNPWIVGRSVVDCVRLGTPSIVSVSNYSLTRRTGLTNDILRLPTFLTVNINQNFHRGPDNDVDYHNLISGGFLWEFPAELQFADKTFQLSALGRRYNENSLVLVPKKIDYSGAVLRADYTDTVIPPPQVFCPNLQQP